MDTRVTTAIIQAFRSSKTEEEKIEAAKAVLDRLCHPWLVSKSIEEADLTVKQEKRIFIELLYGLYYGEIDLEELNRWSLLQTIATVVDDKTLERLLDTLSQREKEQLIAYCHTRDREGSFFILQKLHPPVGITVSVVKFLQQLTELVGLMHQALENLLKGKVPEVQMEQLKQLKAFAGYKYTPQECSRFFELFGDAGYVAERRDEPTSLSLKIQTWLLLFQRGVSLTQLEATTVYHIYGVISSLVAHMEALFRHPEYLQKGLELFTPVIATKNKALEKMPALTSIVEGLKTVCAIAGHTVKEIPIVIFDQSDKEIFGNNRLYIERLCSKTGCRVLHVSNDEALHLAEKLGVAALIDTTKHASMGYCGARNCQFLLTAVVAEREGALLMVDDDIELARGSLISSALASYQMRSGYETTSGTQMVGRVTQSNISYVDLQELLDSLGAVHLFPVWTNRPTYSSMAKLSHPALCLNIPHGCEERHVDLAAKKYAFIQMIKHQAGTRFPDKMIPTHFFVGIADYLKDFIPYTFLVGTISHLVDPIGQFGHTLLPWNDPAVRGKFSSFHQIVECIGSFGIQKELQRRFLEKTKEFFEFPAKETMKFRYDIKRLLELDVERVVSEFRARESLTAEELQELERLGSLYSFFQEDLTRFWEMGKALSTGRKLGTQDPEYPNPAYPISYGFYLLAEALGGETFCQAVAKLATKLKL